MKRRFGCLRRILLWGILLGVLGAVGLGWLGYEKAEAAEAEKGTVAELRTVYLGKDGVALDVLPGREALEGVIGGSGIVDRIFGRESGFLMANFLVDSYYLLEDDTISAAIGRKILACRLMKSYSEEELIALCWGIMGDMPDDRMRNILDFSKIGDEASLWDFLTVLEDCGILSEELTEELRARFASDF